MDLRSLLQIALRIEGFEVIAYANGAEFMAVIDEAEPSDVYIIDINLGGMRGFELCQIIKSFSKTKTSRVILISANAEVQQLTSEVRADDYLIKPFTQKELTQKIVNVLRN